MSVMLKGLQNRQVLQFRTIKPALHFLSTSCLSSTLSTKDHVGSQVGSMTLQFSHPVPAGKTVSDSSESPKLLKGRVKLAHHLTSSSVPCRQPSVLRQQKTGVSPIVDLFLTRSQKLTAVLALQRYFGAAGCLYRRRTSLPAYSC